METSSSYSSNSESDTVASNMSIGDVADSKRPLLIIPKVLRLRVTRRSATALARYPQKLFAGKSFVKMLVTAQTQVRSYSEQQRAFGNSNICICEYTFVKGAYFTCEFNANGYY